MRTSIDSRLADALKRDRIESQWLQPSAFDDYEPRASKQARGALFIPNHGFVGVTALTLAAADAAQKYGATFVSGTGAIRIFAMANGRVAVASSSAVWEGDRVVLAAGSWSSMITVQDADRVPVKPIRGQLIQLRTDSGALHRVIWGPDGYLVPWPDGSQLAGSTVEDVGFDENYTDEAVAAESGGFAGAGPRKAEVTSIRTVRPKGPDDLPVLGRSRRCRDDPCDRALPQRRHVRAADGKAVMIWYSIAPRTLPARSGSVDFRSVRPLGGLWDNIGRMALLKPAEITKRLKDLDGWAHEGQAIKKQFTFQDFPEAVLFVSALVPGAEDADHHPDIEIHYKRVILSYSTHDAGGLTQKDFDGAAMADAVASSLPHLEEFGDG
jgi:pterin-4a-carbinolamine dehydratase